MTLKSIVASAALETQYKYDPDTKVMIASLYQKVTGKAPPPKKNMMRWFLQTYQFNSDDDMWYHRERIVLH